MGSGRQSVRDPLVPRYGPASAPGPLALVSDAPAGEGFVVPPLARARVLAKVTRDRLMLDYAAQFPAYGFAEHKGYGTAKHLAAIAKHGACPIHRLTFAPLKQPEQKLF